MKDGVLIGIDAGTSVIKSIAFTTKGEQIASAAIPNRYQTFPDGGAEQDMARHRDANGPFDALGEAEALEMLEKPDEAVRVLARKGPLTVAQIMDEVPDTQHRIEQAHRVGQRQRAPGEGCARAARHGPGGGARLQEDAVHGRHQGRVHGHHGPLAQQALAEGATLLHRHIQKRQPGLGPEAGQGAAPFHVKPCTTSRRHRQLVLRIIVGQAIATPTL